MVALYQTFEAGTNGNTISTSDTGSGNAFDTVTLGTGASAIYDTGSAVHAALGCKFGNGTAGGNSFLAWTSAGKLGGTFTSFAFRHYIQIPSAPHVGANVCRVMSSAANAARVAISTGSKLQMFNAANTQVGVNSTTTLSNATVYRLEVQIVASTTAGSIAWQLYSGESTTALETASQTGLVLTASFDEFRPVDITTSSIQTIVQTDDIALVTGTTTAIGPVLPVAPISTRLVAVQRAALF